MKVEREAVHRVPEGQELTLEDFGLLVMHLQTKGEAPPHARVHLRNDMIRLTWDTEQESQAEFVERQARERAAREQRDVELASDPDATRAEPAEVELAHADTPTPSTEAEVVELGKPGGRTGSRAR